jgi:hypothetical protein
VEWEQREVVVELKMSERSKVSPRIEDSALFRKSYKCS